MKESAEQKNRRVLVIDDMPSIHDDFRKIFRVKGGGDKFAETLFDERTQPARIAFEIESASQGQEGFEKVKDAIAKGRPFALAFVDIRMPPGWDGIQTVEEIWAVDPDVQVVICTAYTDYSWGEMVQRLGYSDRMLILRKPFDNIEVLQIATALTEKWSLIRQLRANPGQANARASELETAVAELRGNLAACQQNEARLRREAAIFRILGQNFPAGLLLVDSEGKCQYANERWCAISGLSIDRTLGDGWARAVHPDDMEAVAHAWIEDSPERSLEFRIRRTDESIRRVHFRRVSARSDQGETVGQVVLISDLPERR